MLEAIIVIVILVFGDKIAKWYDDKEEERKRKKLEMEDLKARIAELEATRDESGNKEK